MQQVTKYYVVDLRSDLAGPFTTRAEVETKLVELRKKLPGDTVSIETRVTLEEEKTPTYSTGYDGSWG